MKISATVTLKDQSGKEVRSSHSQSFSTVDLAVAWSSKFFAYYGGLTLSGNGPYVLEASLPSGAVRAHLKVEVEGSEGPHLVVQWNDRVRAGYKGPKA